MCIDCASLLDLVELMELETLLAEPYPDIWAWDTASDFDARFAAEPPWNHMDPSVAPPFAVGQRIRHPLWSSTTVLRVGKTLFGNVYRLVTFNDVTITWQDEPTYWVGDYDEAVVVAAQGRE